MQGHHQFTPRSSRHWAQRAEEARTLAEQMYNPDAIALMLDIAEKYDAMAARAAWLEGVPPAPRRLLN